MWLKSLNLLEISTLVQSINGVIMKTLVNVILSFFLLSTLTHAAVAMKPAEKPVVSAVLSTSSKININTASVTVLTNSVKGIGVKRAEAIVNYRDAHGLFKTVEDLANVSGIGAHFVEKHHDEISNKFSVNG